MISAFETSVRLHPQKTCFLYVNEAGEEEAYSYREVRMISAALARILRRRGVRQGDCVSVDLANTPAFAFLLLAAAYGGFVLVALNHRLTASEKLSRVMEIDRRHGLRVAATVDDSTVTDLINSAMAHLSGDDVPAVVLERPSRSVVKTRVERSRKERARTLFGGRIAAMEARPRSTRANVRAATGQGLQRRRDETARQDAVEGVIHFAEHAASVFDRSSRALVMFTSGTTGHPKAVALTWENIIDAALVSNRVLNKQGEGLWQAALPLYHIGGFQVVVRSILNGSPFALYHSFDAKQLIAHGKRIGATHVSVVDKMLQDLLAHGSRETLARYECMLLGGGPLNPSTLARACASGVRVYASYGMTETSSQIACALVTPSFQGGLHLLEGYEAQIVDPDAQGVGRLAVKGPGIFNGYLNARAAFTVDGFFLTGDSAALLGGRLYVKERTEDMFVSGGENVYPAEICQRLLQIPSVSDAYVFGAHDARWGRRPIAFVERDRRVATAAGAQASGQQALPPTNHLVKLGIEEQLQARLSKLYQPKHVFVVDQFPRSGIGKVNRGLLQESYQQRIQVEKVMLYRISMPFKKPFHTPKETLRHREVIIVEVTDYAGRTGLGECSTFTTDWYLPEILDDDERVLRERLAPVVLETPMLHPTDAEGVFASYPELEDFPFARAAIEQALWDLYGKIVQKPLWQLIGGEAQGLTKPPTPAQLPADQTAPETILAPAGVVLGVGPVGETVALARQCVEAGYSRLKLKVVPGSAFACASAVREAFPQIMLSVDANQSFTFRSMDELVGLDSLRLSWIEEPLALDDPSAPPSTDIFARLSKLQSAMKTPICVDESIEYPRDLARALRYPNLTCFAVKLSKFGGVEPTIEFMRLAKARGMKVWMSGMYETGIGRRFSAAFESVAAVSMPGDVGATSRYFATDITNPPYETVQGSIPLNTAGHPYGIGCELDRQALQSVLISRTAIG
ncbi:o-succinylbenzoate synthase [Xiamenia xianingshaonis]|uniref:o-succinylbenzoate synthase n=1 Tax=Xiamenia xianingshaonis TaxID=2682776 RepID=A0A9E6SUC7_9ACTN|nr:o-succinylbenzoate synthase [Xiamenia xianingshaonis]NHM13911.1 o-succinylbenzoate synthase [Xiamenia xianingshaonis]QTU84400.1 o-succinylbenzoate synthase [Xiamenia xianingshaonis]